MIQSRVESLIEICINIASGFIVSLFVWQYIAAPLYGFQVTLLDNLGITAIFTVTAIIRGYFWRRFFARGVHTKVVEMFK